MSNYFKILTGICLILFSMWIIIVATTVELFVVLRARMIFSFATVFCSVYFCSKGAYKILKVFEGKDIDKFVEVSK